MIPRMATRGRHGRMIKSSGVGLALREQVVTPSTANTVSPPQDVANSGEATSAMEGASRGDRGGKKKKKTRDEVRGDQDQDAEGASSDDPEKRVNHGSRLNAA